MAFHHRWLTVHRHSDKVYHINSFATVDTSAIFSQCISIMFYFCCFRRVITPQTICVKNFSDATSQSPRHGFNSTAEASQTESRNSPANPSYKTTLSLSLEDEAGRTATTVCIASLLFLVYCQYNVVTLYSSSYKHAYTEST